MHRCRNLAISMMRVIYALLECHTVGFSGQSAATLMSCDQCDRTQHRFIRAHGIRDMRSHR